MLRTSYSIRARRRLIAICAGATVVYLAVLSGQRALDGYRARQEVASAGREIEALRAQNLTIQAQLSTAMQDPEIEREARNELGLVKPGDRPVVLLWPDGSPPQAVKTTDRQPEPPWRAWLRLFADVE